MARNKKTVPLHGLDEVQVKALKEGIEKVEAFEERAAQINADKRAALDRLGKVLEPLGFSSAQIKMVVSRRKKDRDRVKSDDIAVRKLESALGMTTADLFDEVANTMASSEDPGEVAEASLIGGNAVEEDDSNDEIDEADAENIRNEGRAAWARSISYGNCPDTYPMNSAERRLWQEGWSLAQQDFEDEQSNKVVDLATAAR